eukprot:111414-Rhodomonas_salina.2
MERDGPLQAGVKCFSARFALGKCAIAFDFALCVLPWCTRGGVRVRPETDSRPAAIRSLSTGLRSPLATMKGGRQEGGGEEEEKKERFPPEAEACRENGGVSG